MYIKATSMTNWKTFFEIKIAYELILIFRSDLPQQCTVIKNLGKELLKCEDSEICAEILGLFYTLLISPKPEDEVKVLVLVLDALAHHNRNKDAVLGATARILGSDPSVPVGKIVNGIRELIH